MEFASRPLKPTPIRVWELDLREERCAALEAYLSAGEQQRAARFHDPELGQRWRRGRGGLRLLLASQLGQAPRELAFELGSRGKPRLADVVAGGLEFNTSHSGNKFLIATAHGVAVGIDIERWRTEIDTLTIASRYFANAESRRLRACDPAQRAALFFRLWTRKEAWLKATGLGLSGQVQAVDVSDPHPRSAVRILAGSEASGEWTVQDLDCDPGYSAAISAAGSDWVVQRQAWPEFGPH